MELLLGIKELMSVWRFLDHTIDRVVDVGLIIAIGYNAAFVIDPLAGWAAALLTLLGSYMGTQAQSGRLG